MERVNRLLTLSHTHTDPLTVRNTAIRVTRLKSTHSHLRVRKKMNMKLIILLIVSSALSLSTQSISLCPTRCTCDEAKLSVDCKEAGLDLVPITLNPSLSELHLSRNQIKSVSSSFTFYRKLQFLDLSSNALSTIGVRNFQSQSSLKVLNLNRNRIFELKKDAFLGLTSLRSLTLSENELKDIDERVFHSLKHLEKLDLSGNSMSYISSHSFHGLINLKSLYLQRNRLHLLPSESMMFLTNLTKLDLGFNLLGDKLTRDSIPHLLSLNELNLEANKIQYIDYDAFDNVKDTLKMLNLAANNLEYIPSNSFDSLASLEKLNIGTNRIASIGDEAFRGLINLKTLILRHDDSLKVIETNAFIYNVQLEKLVLEYCPNLMMLHEDTFSRQKETLKKVSLRSNGFNYLHEKLLHWDDLESLDVRGNPFNCSCSIFWFWDFLNKRANLSFHSDHLKEILCAEPTELRGMEISSISLNKLNCFTFSSNNLFTFFVPIVLPVTVLASLLCAGVCGLLLWVFVKHRRRRMTEQRLREFFSSNIHTSGTILDHNASEEVKSLGGHNNVHEYTLYSDHINSYEPVNLYESPLYQEVDRSPLPPISTMPLIMSKGVNKTAKLSSDASNSVSVTRNFTTLANSVPRHQQQQQQPLQTYPASLSSYPETCPYASSIVIKHPIKANCNLYRL